MNTKERMTFRQQMISSARIASSRVAYLSRRGTYTLSSVAEKTSLLDSRSHDLIDPSKQNAGWALHSILSRHRWFGCKLFLETMSSHARTWIFSEVEE